ncbi:hypothetical protein GALMADRAFT_217730 [Galerina marginata CBS 339.88]|uniref:Uncharacterized protein n=1 Tax=Galerina marginata (strain CBS 339.88) TaxID=685588 RepID=A0A067S2F6_GALM3|nr:hypothetical protein GALMADRAFT_217730 [Galerina marginata CBS 339.88]
MYAAHCSPLQFVEMYPGTFTCQRDLDLAMCVVATHHNNTRYRLKHRGEHQHASPQPITPPPKKPTLSAPKQLAAGFPSSGPAPSSSNQPATRLTRLQTQLTASAPTRLAEGSASNRPATQAMRPVVLLPAPKRRAPGSPSNQLASFPSSQPAMPVIEQLVAPQANEVVQVPRQVGREVDKHSVQEFLHSCQPDIAYLCPAFVAFGIVNNNYLDAISRWSKEVIFEFLARFAEQASLDGVQITEMEKYVIYIYLQKRAKQRAAN